MNPTRRQWCIGAAGMLAGLVGGASETTIAQDRKSLPEAEKKDPWGGIPTLRFENQRENLENGSEYGPNDTFASASHRAGTIIVSRWRFGMRIEAVGDEFRRIQANTFVPNRIENEQEATRGELDTSSGVTVTFQNLTDTRRMRIVGAALPGGRTLRAIQEMTIHRILWPRMRDVSELRTPAAAQMPGTLRKYLKPATMIESTHPSIVSATKGISSEMRLFYPTPKLGEPDLTGSDWRRIEEIYDWTRRRVRFEDNRGQPQYGAVETLEKSVGDCDQITYLFVALCRASGIPARVVQVPDHVYPEFAMVDGVGKLRWFPCQSAGTRAFGEMPDGRPIMARGDEALAISPISGASRNSQGLLRPELVCEKISEEPPVPFDPDSFDPAAYAIREQRIKSGITGPG